MQRILQQQIHCFYRKWVRPHLEPHWQQRFKLIWTVWGYYPILRIPSITFFKRLELIITFINIDWYIQHGHWPGEIALVVKCIGQRKAEPGEVVVEAGCWNGGSTAKLSHICEILGYQLLIFDSFEGVEKLPNNIFAGKYASTLNIVKFNIQKYGKLGVCQFFPGWFADTLAKKPINQPVKVALIDCDLAKGTFEVLKGILPAMLNHGFICSQDFQIEEVRVLLNDEEAWCRLGVNKPEITAQYRQMVVMPFPMRLIQ